MDNVSGNNMETEKVAIAINKTVGMMVDKKFLLLKTLNNKTPQRIKPVEIIPLRPTAHKDIINDISAGQTG